MKSLYQRRTDGDYKGYTKDSFYFNSTEQLWCWKQSSKNIIHKASTIEELKKIKNKELIGQGNYDHKNDSTHEQDILVQKSLQKLQGLEVKNMLVCF